MTLQVFFKWCKQEVIYNAPVKVSYYYIFFIISPSAYAENKYPYTGFYISGTQLHDVKGHPFVMRGVNYPYLWFQNRLSAIDDIAGMGANTVRVVLGNGVQWPRTSGQEVSTIIKRCKVNQVVCVLEVYDTTGYTEDPKAATLSSAVDYWLSDDVKRAIQGQEAYIIINIANEPFGNKATEQQYLYDTQQAIQNLRTGGLNHTLMIDAANWGQDWQKIMLNNAVSLFESDPQRNLMFSVHMYEVFEDREAIESYMRAYIENNLTLVIGEFGHAHLGQDIDEYAVMEYAYKYGIGTLAWSWSGNNATHASLDLVNDWDPQRLTAWGHSVFKSTFGIEATAKPATVFTD